MAFEPYIFLINFGLQTLPQSLVFKYLNRWGSQNMHTHECAQWFKEPQSYLSQQPYRVTSTLQTQQIIMTQTQSLQKNQVLIE